MAGNMLGSFLGALDESLNTVFALASMVGIDPYGMIIAFSQIPKMITYMRFFNIYYGEMLENFLVEIAKAIDSKKVRNTDIMVTSQVGYRSKLTIYDRPIVFIEVYYSRAVLFMVSWVVKVIANIILLRSRIKKTINK